MRIVLAIALVMSLTVCEAQEKAVTVGLIGDSTVAVQSGKGLHEHALRVLSNDGPNDLSLGNNCRIIYFGTGIARANHRKLA